MSLRIWCGQSICWIEVGQCAGCAKYKRCVYLDRQLRYKDVMMLNRIELQRSIEDGDKINERGINE